MTEGQWADHYAENEAADTSMVRGTTSSERKCPICAEKTELLEHHVSYSERFGLFPIEIVLEVCMSCHHKIHKKKGFHEELNPVEHPTEDSAMQYEDFVAGLLLDCEETGFPPDTQSDEKYRLYKDEGEWKMEAV